MFNRLNELLEQKGVMMRGGSIVDATIIAAPSSTKNKKNERDSEMHQTRKGNQWYFGMKSHIGVDAGSGLVHTVVNTAANVSDVTRTGELMRDDDVVVYGDSGYTGAEKRPEIADDAKKSRVTFRISRRKGSVKAKWDKAIETQKSRVRCKVEHPFLIVKRYFGYCKLAYRGLKKNGSRLFALFASANILMCARAGRLGRCHA
jgi:IS5 family transposase